MALPGITLPAGIPILLGEGHAIEESSVFAAFKPTTGHRRMRRIYTVPDRVVPVNWSLNSAQMAAFDDWFENALDVGSNFFSIRVKDQDSAGLLWWKAKWVEPYTAEPLAPNRWRVSGSVRLFGEGTATPPNVFSMELAIAVPLNATAVLTAPQPLELEITVALVSTEAVGALNFSAALDQVSFAVTVSAGLGSMFLTGLAPTAETTTFVFTSISPPPGALSFSGGTPAASQSNNMAVIPGAASLSLSGLVPPMGRDPYFASVTLLLHGDGTNGSTTIVDNSPSPKTSTLAGGVAISTAQYRFNGASIAFDGSGDSLYFAADAGFNFGSGNFCVELFFRPSSAVDSALVNYLIQNGGTGHDISFGVNYFGSALSGKVRSFIYESANQYKVDSTGALTLNTWCHIAFQRESNVLYLFIDGVLNDSLTITGVSANDLAASPKLHIGRYFDGTENWADGYIDEVRITKGVARYSISGFTPPSAPFPDSA